METFKIINGFENYSVSNYGNIKRNNTDRLLNFRDSFGYNRIRLYDGKCAKNINVHRLVAEYFISNPENKPQVNHIDGNRANNHYSNLEWVTPSENMQHKIKTLKKQVRKISLEKNGIILNFNSIKEAAENLNLDAGNLSRLLNNKKEQYKGYKLYKI